MKNIFSVNLFVAIFVTLEIIILNMFGAFTAFPLINLLLILVVLTNLSVWVLGMVQKNKKAVKHNEEV